MEHTETKRQEIQSSMDELTELIKALMEIECKMRMPESTETQRALEAFDNRNMTWTRDSFSKLHKTVRQAYHLQHRRLAETEV